VADLEDTMTLAMPDSITPGNLPAGYPAYLSYVDGNWPTAAAVRAGHPSAQDVRLTVRGGTTAADGCDIENGDLTPQSGAAWAAWYIASWPSRRPVLYASRDTMPDVLAALPARKVTRAQVRILTAHYGAGEHICGPSTCKASFQADGTQWTDEFDGVGGTKIDMSVLADDFFGTPAPPSAWVFGAVRGLKAVPGHTSVLLSWSAPADPAPAPVGHYQVTVRKDGEDVKSYPRDVPKTGGAQSWQGGSLTPGTTYEVLVRAVTADVNGHGSPWAAVTFTTGHG
jgi:hypothetical protein